MVTACNPNTTDPSSLSTSLTSPTVPPPSLTITPTYTPTVTTPPQTSYAPPSSFIEFTVVRIIDGDTIEVRLGNELYTVRYIGIDAPELDEPFGIEAMEKGAFDYLMKPVDLKELLEKINAANDSRSKA